jgi:amino acid adenylation domain-containing protein
MSSPDRRSTVSPAKRALLARLARGEGIGSGTEIPRVPGDGPLPLSYAQDRVWFTSRLAPDVRLFNLFGGIRLPGAFDVAELERRLARSIHRHDALRTSVPLVDDEPRAVVAPSVPARIPVIDRSAGGSVDPGDCAAVAALAREAVIEVAGPPYRLDHAPLWRLALVRLPGDEQVLVMGAHHLVLDGISFVLLGHELLSPVHRPDPPVRYVDFASWQKGLVADGGIAAELAYWRRRLDALPPPLELGLGRPRPARRSLRGATLSVEIPDDLLRRVRHLGRNESVTPYITFLAGFVALLHRYTGLDDLLVGASVSGRTRPELHNLLGMFVNQVALRTRISGRPTFRELLASTRQTLSEALSRQNVPFELLVRELRLGGAQSHPPLVQVGFNMPTEEIASDVPVVDVPFTAEGAQLDLTVHIRSRGSGGLEMLFEYATDLFDEPTVRRMAGHYLRLLDRLTAAPGRPIDDVPLLEERERVVLLSGSGPSADTVHRTSAQRTSAQRTSAQRTSAHRSAAPEALPTPLHRLVAEQARRTPQRTAVVSGGQEVTYAELAARAAGLARVLRESGVDLERPVGVYLRPGLDLPVALLAVWQAGGAYVPLDPDQPAARTGLILTETSAPAVLTSRDLADAVPGGDRRVVCVEDAPAAGAAPAAADPAHAVDAAAGPAHMADAAAGPAHMADAAADPARAVAPANAAYVIYTSGTTGAPKGVVVTHGGIANRVLWTVRAHRLRAGDRVLQKTRLTFDAAGWEIFAPLVNGGTVVMPPPGADQDPELLLRTVAQHDVTVLQVVPSVLRLLVETEGWSACRALRLLFCAGEPLHAELCARVRALADVEIVNTYGPTECSIDVTAARYDPEQSTGPVPIGRPIDGTRLLVLDRRGEPVPIGLPGELYVGGRGVGRGYLGRPDLTATAFVPDPHGGPGSRLYRTGDLVRWREDGDLEFVGRRDDQVKINGVRVELGEVESVLAGHPRVRAVAVTAPRDHTGGRRLVAYVVGDAADRELRSFLGERLPAPMVPGRFVGLDALPLTSSGKVNRTALPVPDRGESGPGGVAPRDHVERTVAGVWADLLDLDVGQVGVHDDFFALGGHSLLLTRLAARLRALLGVELTVGDLFGAPTVAEQLHVITAKRASGAWTLEPIRPADRAGPLPLSSGQRRIWFLQQYDPTGTLYNVPVAFRLTGHLDVTALRAALDEIVARHEVLRTTFETGLDGSPRQIVHPPRPVSLLETDLSGLATAPAREQAQRLVDLDTSNPFDLAAGPMVRARLVSLAGDEHVLGLTFHHIVSDGWSAGVFWHELATLYAAFLAGEPSPLPPLPVQYADYAAWQSGRFTDDRLDRQREYWHGRLAGLPTVALPTARPRPARLSSAGDYHTFRVPARTADALRAVSRRAGCSLFMTLLAGFQTLLARYTGEDDIVVGTSIAGRALPETEELIGFFVNTLVLRSDLAGDPTVTELLSRVRTVALGAFEHQDLPFERLVEQLQPVRDLSRHPLFQIMFEMTAGGTDLALPGLATEPLCEEIPWRNAKFDLTVEMSEQPDGTLGGYLEYATELFDRPAIERMARHFTAVLDAFGADPDQHLSEIRLADEDERRELAEWATGPALERAALVPGTIAQQAAETPDAVAVIAGGRRLTYRELDTRANQLAHYLRDLGVGPETVVAVCPDNGGDFVVAVLGVLKAGGAYLPLDPEQPTARLAYLLDTAAAAVVLTTTDRRARISSGVRGTSSTRVLALDDPAVVAALTAAPTGPVPPRSHPGHTAYVIFTSGSTGAPKAVLIGHQALADSTAARPRYYGDPVGVFYLLSPVIFDASIAGLFWTLCTGGTLLMPPPGRRLADEMSADIALHRVTHVLAVPSLLGQLVDWHGHAGMRPYDSLHVIITAGESCPPDLVPRLATMAPGAAIHNEYGPTEAGVWASAGPLRPDAVAGRPTIGRPIANAQCHVLDSALRPVPAGVPGELYLGGAGLARGYAGSPVLTAERFVANPLAGDGSRLYRTGDLVRWTPDGQLDFLGRLDEQLKIDGYRIEPAEIEAVLMAHPQVGKAVVVERAEPAGGRGLVACVVADRTRPVTAGQLRDFCRARLPDHLVPGSFVPVDEIPLSASGKIDRAALAALPGAATAGRGAGGDVSDPPRTETERRLAAIWCEVLGVDRVGVHDDFFALGGHSLQAVRIATRLQEIYDVELPLRRLFEATTVTALAALIEEAVEAEIAVLSDADIETMLAEGDIE